MGTARGRARRLPLTPDFRVSDERYFEGSVGLWFVTHRARPDGSHHTTRVFRPVSGAAMPMRVNRYLHRVAPIDG